MTAAVIRAGSQKESSRLAITLVVAFILHLFFFTTHPLLQRLLFKSTPQARIEVQTIDTDKLEAIRNQWSKKDRGLLLKRDDLRASDLAPENARYDSDKNIRVEKEQRAKNSQTIPQFLPQSATQQNNSITKKNEAMPNSRAKLPQLSSLGLSLPIPPSPKDQSKTSIRNNNKNSPHSPENDQLQNKAAGDQAILDNDLPEGAMNMLNTQQSVYYSYYSRLYESIGPIWQGRIRDMEYSRKIPSGIYTTQVEVIFDTQGNLMRIEEIHPSGISELDRAVRESWQRIGRFPNPPSGLISKDRRVHTGWSFSVQVSPGSIFRYLPPERQY